MKNKIQGITVKFIDDCQNIKYAIYCMKFSSKVYIGQTTGTIENRMYGHIYEAINHKADTVLNKAIRKYKCFSVEVLDECKTIEGLNALEEYFIKEFNSVVPNGYNILNGGCNRKMNEVSKIKLSISLKLKYKTDEEFYANRVSKQSEVSKIMWQSDDYRSKMSNAAKQNWQKEEYRNKVIPVLLNARQKCCKQIYQYDKNLKLVGIHKNGPRAAKQNNLLYNQSKNIVYAAKRNHKNSKKFITCYGFIWSYERLN